MVPSLRVVTNVHTLLDTESKYQTKVTSKRRGGYWSVSIGSNSKAMRIRCPGFVHVRSECERPDEIRVEVEIQKRPVSTFALWTILARRRATTFGAAVDNGAVA